MKVFIGILVTGLFTTGAAADQIRFPLIMDAHYAPALVLTKTVKDNSGYRFEQCHLDFHHVPGPIELTLFDAVNAPNAKCRPLNTAWRSMTDQTSNDAFLKELEERIGRHIGVLNLRARTGYLIDVIASSLFLGVSPLNLPWLSRPVRTVAAAVGFVGLVRALPAYMHYQPFAISDVVAQRLAALDPSSDEMRVTSSRVYRAIVHALRETLADVPAALPVDTPPATSTPPAEVPAPAPIEPPSPVEPVPVPAPAESAPIVPPPYQG